MEYRTRIIEKAIEKHLDVKTTNDYLKLLERTDSQRVLEIRIGTFAEATGNYKTVAQRCNELGIETIGDLLRYGGREMRKHENVGVKTAALQHKTIEDAEKEYQQIKRATIKNEAMKLYSKHLITGKVYGALIKYSLKNLI